MGLFNNCRAGIVSQARMTSTRLPGKVLLKCKGLTVLEHHIKRLSWSKLPVIVATTTNKSDDPIVELLEKINIPYYRGDENNVLQRYYQTAETYHLDVIIRVTSDCPLIDGNLIKDALNAHLCINSDYLYTSNGIERTYPRGFDFEIFSGRLLKEAYQKATLPFDMEHVTPFIHQNRLGHVKFKHIRHSEDKSDYRITLDTIDDWRLIQKLIEEYCANELGFLEIIKLLDEHKSLIKINSNVKQKGFLG